MKLIIILLIIIILIILIIIILIITRSAESSPQISDVLDELVFLQVMLQPVENLGDLHTCLNAHLTRYNEEFGNVRLDIMLSDFTIAHIVRMHRILSFHHG